MVKSGQERSGQFESSELRCWDRSNQGFFTQNFCELNIFGPLFLYPTFFWTRHFFDTKSLGPNFFATKIILELTLLLTRNFFGTRIIWDPTLFLTQNLFGPKMHLKLEFDKNERKYKHMSIILFPVCAYVTIHYRQRQQIDDSIYLEGRRLENKIRKKE